MKLTEKQLKGIIAEEVQKALSGSLNVAEYDVEKSIKQLLAMIESETEKFEQKMEDAGGATYDAYVTKLYSISENLEYFLKRLKTEGPFGLM
jgi:phage host-nuclease inhibitor protein Gam